MTWICAVANVDHCFLTCHSSFLRSAISEDVDDVIEPPHGSRSRSMALGRVWIMFGSRKNTKLENVDCPKGVPHAVPTGGSPQRPVHAVLARFGVFADVMFP